MSMDRPTDTEMLNWLQSQTKGYGLGWVVRESTTGRGMRIHESSNNGDSDIEIKDKPNPSIREAIYLAMVKSEETQYDT